MLKIPDNFDVALRDSKLRMLKMHYDAKAGHLGGNLSCIDFLMCLYHCKIDDGDEFLLSKGHSAGALYSTLWSLGLIEENDMESFSKDNSILPAHPSGPGIPGLLFSTGSLGHGPSLCAGLAIAKKMKGENGNIYCLCSDGEWQEGSCWEALIFSIHHKLDNFILIIDQNGLQGFGKTDEVISNSDLTKRLDSFGANVQTIDGHNPQVILDALNCVKDNKFNIIVLNTVKGNGLHNAGLLESHYLPLNENEYLSACNFIKESK
jgi:transketolase